METVQYCLPQVGKILVPVIATRCRELLVPVSAKIAQNISSNSTRGRNKISSTRPQVEKKLVPI